jgi:hypothetical protein
VIFGRFWVNGQVAPNSLTSSYDGAVRIVRNQGTPDDVTPSVADEALRYVHYLEGVELLCIRHMPVTDAGLRHLRGMNGLHEVVLDHTQVTGAGEAEIGKWLPNCRLITRIPESPNNDPDGPPDWLTRRRVWAPISK